MLVELLLVLCAIVAGLFFGIITGLLPGVHINLVSAILLSLAPAIALHVPLVLVCILIMAMSVAHTFLDSIPSVFLGAPDDEKALGVLPGHRYLLRGNGLMAVKLMVIGGMLGTIITAVFFIPLGYLIQLCSEISKPYIFWILLAIVIFMVFKDKKRWWALIIFMLSGILGVITLRLPLDEPLLPLLSGMFGTATLLYSINENQSMPAQQDLRHTDIDIVKTVHGSAIGVIAGFLTALYPGVSASSAAAITSRGSKLGDHGFLVLIGSLGAASFVLSLASFWFIQKARHGSMIVITQLISITPAIAVTLVSVSLVAAGIAAMLTIWMGRRAASWLPRMPYRTTCISVIIFVTGIVFFRTGLLGLCVLATSTAVGLLPASLKTARSQAMGCLLLPILVMLW